MHSTLHQRALVALGTMGLGALLATSPVWAIDETRRQVGSQSIDTAFNFTGTGVRIGQMEDNVPLAHTNVPFTPRPGDAGAGLLHTLEVAGIMVSNHAQFRGMAPAATLFSDNFVNNGQMAGTIAGAGDMDENNFLNGIRFLAGTQQARVINASTVIHVPPDPARPNSPASLGLDWLITQPRASGGDFLFVKSAGNNGTSPVTEPGGTFNAMTVGAVTNEAYQNAAQVPPVNTMSPLGPVNRRWNVVANFSNFGTPGTVVAKPDIVAPGGRIDTDRAEVGFTMATAGNGFAASAGRVGTSYAAPHVAGIAAQLYQQAPNTNHRTMKAVLMNAADKTVRGISHTPPVGGAPHPSDPFYRHLDSPWTAGLHGLDSTSGAGMVDAWGASINLAGSGNGRIGTRTGTLANNAQPDFLFNFPVGVDTRVVATVTWDRQVTRTPPPVPAQPHNETFAANAAQPHFALGIQGPQIVLENTAGGSVQHINTILNQPGQATLVVHNDSGAGGAPGAYSVAWAISPNDATPGTQDVFFTLRDQIHRPRAERTPPTGVTDRIREGRAGSEVRLHAIGDALGVAAEGVESNIYQSTMNASNTMFRTGQQMGLTLAGDANPDDSVADVSFGRDNIRAFSNRGGRLFFSVDPYATGLSPVLVDNSPSGVFGEATIVNEAAGDIFRSSRLLPGAGAITNANRRVLNIANADFLHPMNNRNTNTTFADSYYMGLVGGRTSDNEDDVAGLEGLGKTVFDPSVTSILPNNFIFFTLDRGSPSGHTADVMVARLDMPNAPPHLYASAAQLGLNATDHIDGLLLQDLGMLDAAGWPVYSLAEDLIVFSVDRDSTGMAGSAVTIESIQGEVAGDLFFASVSGSNMLFLEATDLGLQEFGFGNRYNWLSDNLDALDIPDTRLSKVPEPATLTLWVIGLACLVARSVRMGVGRETRSAQALNA